MLTLTFDPDSEIVAIDVDAVQDKHVLKASANICKRAQSNPEVHFFETTGQEIMVLAFRAQVKQGVIARENFTLKYKDKVIPLDKDARLIDDVLPSIHIDILRILI